MLYSFLKQYRESLPELSAEQVAALEGHLSLLDHWNRAINLTAIKRKSEAVSRHIGESLFLAARLPAGALKVCDLGSGGGFPGIPVAVARPDCSVTLVESDVRKGVFLREASRKIPNVSVVTQRFESVTGEFDWLIARAVNLFGVGGGPVCRRGAYLGKVEETEGRSRNAKRTLGGRYRWRAVPIPWDDSSVLSIGECFT